jgi:hypothetical protein
MCSTNIHYRAGGTGELIKATTTKDKALVFLSQGLGLLPRNPELATPSVPAPQPNQPQTAQVQQAPQTQQEVQAPQELVARRKRTSTTRRRTSLVIESQLNLPSSPSGRAFGEAGVNVPQ